MARGRRSTCPASLSTSSDHAAHIALTTRLTAFQTELSAQGKSRATHEAPAAIIDMAADLFGQMARLMRRAVEARGLPRLANDRPITFSELSIAFAQTHHAFDAFGKRMGYDQPVADAESERRTTELRNDLVRMMNVRIIMGIRTGYLVPSGNQYDDEKGELCQQFEAIVDRLELIVKDEALPDPNEKWF